MHHWWHSEEVNRAVYISLITRFHNVSRWNSCWITFLSSCVLLRIVDVYRHLIWLGTHLSFTFDYVDGSLQFVRLEITAEHVDGTWAVILWVIINEFFLRWEELATLRRIIRLFFRWSIFYHIKFRREMSDITIVAILLWTRGCWTHVIDEVLLCQGERMG